MDYAIGDVQGCYDTLQKLLFKINFSEDRDRLYFLGDVVNRGKKSLETLRFIRSHKDNVNMILGNHDFHLLMCTLTSRKPNSKDTFLDILEAPDRNILIDYMLSRPLLIEQQGFLLVHAGIPPQWSKNEAFLHAELVQNQLQSDNAGRFLSKMYSNEPTKWSNSLDIEQKSRYTINALMRMRFCKNNGELEFSNKMNADKEPKEYKAWFLHENRMLKNKEIVFGHWSTLRDIRSKNIYPLDCGCFWGEYLCALRLNDRVQFSQRSIESN